MKKVLITVLVVILVAAAAVGGYFWYRETHIFVEGAVYPKNAQSLDLRGTGISVQHFDTVREQLPDCEIVWDVPFQGSAVSSNSVSLTITSLTEEEIARMDYFPNLQRVDATGCDDYALLEQLQTHRPECQVVYQVDLGGKAFAPDTTELTLEPGEFDYDTLMENLRYLPQVTSLTLSKTDLTLEQLEKLSAAWSGIDISYTVEISGREADMRTTELDLSGMTSADVEETAGKLALLPELASVELMNEAGESALTLVDVKALKDAAPGASFHYSFPFFGQTISTTDEEVVITDQPIGDEGVEQVRQVLDVLENCSRFVLDNCRLSNETLAQLREDYRDTTKVVWRVWFGKNGSCLTDRETIRAVYGLNDGNCHDLIYCEDARYIDIGHNTELTTVEFVSTMTKLEAIIVSGAPIKDLTPFENCESLVFLELAYCGYVADISPLAACENLNRLNISFTKVSDLSALDEREMVTLSCTGTKVSQEERNRFTELHPDCLTQFSGSQPYGYPWRYVDNGVTYNEYYAMLREVFDYDHAANTYK